MLSYRIERFAQLLEKKLVPGARVLEIGAGEGLLATRLAQRCNVVAIDREKRGSFPTIEITFEELEVPPQSFDAVVLQLVLHHAHDLDAFLAKICHLLKPMGLVAIDDYGWERSDDPAYRAEHADLLTSETMLEALRRHFEETWYEEYAYLDEGRGNDRLGFSFVGVRRSSAR